MGEIADDMMDGHSCSLCGIYFEKEHGYPVVCVSCMKDLTPKERKEYTQATEKEM